MLSADGQQCAKQIMLACAITTAIVFAALQLRQPADGQAETHYSPTTDLETIDKAIITSAQPGEHIDAALYVATDHAVLAALTAAQRRGAKVRLYLDHHQTTALYPTNRLSLVGLAATGAEIRIKAKNSPLMHLKAYSIGDRLLRTGSANTSFDGLHRQDNDLLVIRQRSVIANYRANFASIWDRPTNTSYNAD
jgi:phosphatidylserine/phosphatidylglycerophosphate/cardiolipin synthase-like enzyme